jgi:CII-binding regulator of phage lambda lysogenization HflD
VTEQIIKFLAKNWKEIVLIILLLVVYAKSTYDMNNIINAHKDSQASLKEQIKVLDRTYQAEIRLRDEAIRRYLIEIETLERRYQEKQKEIDRLTEEQRQAIIREFEEDKQLIIDRFVNTYGIRYVE